MISPNFQFLQHKSHRSHCWLQPDRGGNHHRGRQCSDFCPSLPVHTGQSGKGMPVLGKFDLGLQQNYLSAVTMDKRNTPKKDSPFMERKARCQAQNQNKTAQSEGEWCLCRWLEPQLPSLYASDLGVVIWETEPNFYLDILSACPFISIRTRPEYTDSPAVPAEIRDLPVTKVFCSISWKLDSPSSLVGYCFTLCLFCCCITCQLVTVSKWLAISLSQLGRNKTFSPLASKSTPQANASSLLCILIETVRPAQHWHRRNTVWHLGFFPTFSARKNLSKLPFKLQFVEVRH